MLHCATKNIGRYPYNKIRLVCGTCGFAFEPIRGYPMGLWDTIDTEGLPAIWTILCSNCDGDRVHFVDYPHENRL